MTDSDPSAFADIHSHLVPSVDDGAREVEDTIDALHRLTRLGIRKIITTPHLNGSLSRDPPALRDRLDEVSEAWDMVATEVGRTFPEVDFRRGHEVMLDIPDVDFADDRMRLGGSDFVLIEWPRLQVPPGTGNVLRKIVADGLRPIVAHPERYMGLDKELNLVAEWREVGAYMQVNFGSLVGRYGSDAQAFAWKILRRGWADYMSSDFHGHASMKIYFKEARAEMEDVGALQTFHTLTQTNTARVFTNDAPMPVPPLPPETGFWAKVRGLLSQDDA